MEWLPIIAAATSAASALTSANNNAATAESQAQAADYNAAVQRQNAETAMAQGNANEEAQRRKARIIEGQQRAAIAETPGLQGSTTAGDLYEQSVSNAEMDALNIRYNAQLAAVGYKNQAGLDAWNADQHRANASRIKSAGILSAGAAALSGYGSYLGGQAKMTAASQGAA